MVWLCPNRGTERRYTTSKMLPLVRAAALAVWLRMRRMWRGPLGDPRLYLNPALSSPPRQPPHPEETQFPPANAAFAGAPSSVTPPPHSPPHPPTPPLLPP